MPLDYFVLCETWLDHSFPKVQFLLDRIEIVSRRDDRDKHKVSLIEFVTEFHITFYWIHMHWISSSKKEVSLFQYLQ